MNYRREYTLYPRKTVKGKKVYYYRTYDEDGRRTSGRSTGQTSKTAAERWVREQIKKGSIAPGKDITFGKYAENWWIWGKCSYIRKELSKGRRLSHDYADTNRSYLRNNILPYFCDMRLTSITPRKVEAWMMFLVNDRKPLLSTTTANHCLTTLNIMLKEAVWNGYLHTNPAEKVRRLGTKHKEKTTLTHEEVKKLFDVNSIQSIWGNNKST